MKELIANLLDAQWVMGHAHATGKNDHFKSKYVPFEELMDYVKPILNNRGIFIQQVSHEVDGGVCVETILHGHGDSLSFGPVFIRADKATPQGYGSALTYARRYSLSLATGVGADKDDDANAAEKESKPRAVTTLKPKPRVAETPKSEPEGHLILMKGKTTLSVYKTPEAFLKACRTLLKDPDQENDKAIFKASKTYIKQARDEATGDTKTALNTMLALYGDKS